MSIIENIRGYNREFKSELTDCKQVRDEQLDNLTESEAAAELQKIKLHLGFGKGSFTKFEILVMVGCAVEKILRAKGFYEERGLNAVSDVFEILQNDMSTSGTELNKALRYMRLEDNVTDSQKVCGPWMCVGSAALGSVGFAKLMAQFNP